VAERRRKIQERRSFSTSPEWMLSIFSQVFCRVFVCVVIHMNCHTGLELRFRAIQSVSTI
jgi:hypothetical protein